MTMSKFSTVSEPLMTSTRPCALILVRASFQAGHMTLLRHHLHRQGVEQEGAAVLLGQLVFVRVRGHVGLAAPIDDRGLGRAQPLGLGHRVNGGVAAADHRDPLAHRHLVQRPGVQQLDEVQRLIHFGQVLAGNAQAIGAAQAEAHENRVELLLELGHRHILAHLDAGADSTPRLFTSALRPGWFPG
jgi:hypothetical protein